MGEPEEYGRKELISRIGTFFLLLAVGLLVYFLLSDSAGAPELGYFCWGIILTTVGFIFRRQYHRPRPSSGRFSWVGKFLKGKDE
jgi:positive regulator of sigma E activity